MENRHSSRFTGIFPKHVDEITEGLWESYLPGLIEKGLANQSSRAPEEVKFMMRLVDDLIKTRIFEAFERVGMEGRTSRAKKRVLNDIQELTDTPRSE